MSSTQLIKIDIEALARIPTVPAIVLRLVEALADPDVPLQELSSIIKSDPAITSRLVKAANSAMYAGMSKADTLDRCVLRLGRNAVGCLALSFSLSDVVCRSGPHEQQLRETWLQSVIQATAMEYLAKRLRVADSSLAFVAGLLLDIGKLALIHAHGKEYVPLLNEARSGERPLRELERERLGTDHAALAGELMRRWQFPDNLTHLALHHELDESELEPFGRREEFPLIVLANIASSTSDFLFGLRPAQSLQRLEFLLERHWQASHELIGEYLSSVRGKLEETAEILAADINRMPGERELMALAMEQIVNFTIRAATGNAQSDESIALQREHDDIRRRLQQLEQKSCMDSLTGVYNREYFDARLKERIRAATGDRALGILFVDLDSFKALNDSRGHLFGDEVLKQSGVALKAALRSGDIVARFGGEEFVVLLECPDRHMIPVVAERIRARIEGMNVQQNGEPVRVTASVGGVYSVFVPGSISEDRLRNELVHTADSAMYESKRGGRNRCVIREWSAGSAVPALNLGAIVPVALASSLR